MEHRHLRGPSPSYPHATQASNPPRTSPPRPVVAPETVRNAAAVAAAVGKGKGKGKISLPSVWLMVSTELPPPAAAAVVGFARLRKRKRQRPRACAAGTPRLSPCASPPLAVRVAPRPPERENGERSTGVGVRGSGKAEGSGQSNHNRHAKKKLVVKHEKQRQSTVQTQRRWRKHTVQKTPPKRIDKTRHKATKARGQSGLKTTNTGYYLLCNEDAGPSANTTQYVWTDISQEHQNTANCPAQKRKNALVFFLYRRLQNGQASCRSAEAQKEGTEENEGK